MGSSCDTATYLKRLLACVAAFCMGSCSVSRAGAPSIDAPYESFVFVRGDAPITELTVCVSDDDETDDCDVVKDAAGLHIRGSGIAVANSIVHAGRQYIMTAGHICSVVDKWTSDMRSKWLEDDKVVVDIALSMTISVSDDRGGVYIAHPIAVNSKRDLCVLAVEDAKLPLVSIATEYPKRGHRVFNLAAPMGMWEPGTIHRFDGYYSGRYSCENVDEQVFSCDEGDPLFSNFTFPATQGSSGSPVFNARGELVGIVVMVTTNFPNIVFAVRLDDMNALLEKVFEFESTPEGLDWDPGFKWTSTGSELKPTPVESIAP